MAEISLISLVVNILVNVIVLSPVLWIAGRLLAGKDKAKFTDALWIVVLGTIIGAVFQAFLEGILDNAGYFAYYSLKNAHQRFIRDLSGLRKKLSD
jgi:hypothetical protein